MIKINTKPTYLGYLQYLELRDKALLSQIYYNFAQIIILKKKLRRKELKCMNRQFAE